MWVRWIATLSGALLVSCGGVSREGSSGAGVRQDASSGGATTDGRAPPRFRDGGSNAHDGPVSRTGGDARSTVSGDASPVVRTDSGASSTGQTDAGGFAAGHRDAASSSDAIAPARDAQSSVHDARADSSVDPGGDAGTFVDANADVRRDGGPSACVPPSEYRCDYPGLGVKQFGPLGSPYWLWILEDTWTRLENLVSSFPSPPSGCASASLDRDAGVGLAIVSNCPVSGAPGLRVSGEFEFQTTHSVQYDNEFPPVSTTTDLQIVRSAPSGAALTFSDSNGVARFTITDFDLSRGTVTGGGGVRPWEGSTSTIRHTTASYLDARTGRKLVVTLAADGTPNPLLQGRPTYYQANVTASDATALLRGTANGFSFPDTIQFGASGDAGMVDSPFDYYALYSDAEPGLPASAACGTPCADAAASGP